MNTQQRVAVVVVLLECCCVHAVLAAMVARSDHPKEKIDPPR
jgi:hypothetical protein